jgi:hypothetical protein
MNAEQLQQLREEADRARSVKLHGSGCDQKSACECPSHWTECPIWNEGPGLHECSCRVPGINPGTMRYLLEMLDAEVDSHKETAEIMRRARTRAENYLKYGRKLAHAVRVFRSYYYRRNDFRTHETVRDLGVAQDAWNEIEQKMAQFPPPTPTTASIPFLSLFAGEGNE